MARFGIDAFRAFPMKRVLHGQLSFVVARNIAEVWPSQEVFNKAAERSRLLHQLPDIDGVEVVDWGETDGEYPREVVEVIIAVLASPLLAAAAKGIADVVSAWLTSDRRSRRNDQPNADGKLDTVLAVRITKPDGTKIELTIRDDKSVQQHREMIEGFLR